MTLYDLKPAFQQLLRPAVRGFATLGVTPNQLTLFSCFASIAYGCALFFADTKMTWAILPIFLLVRMMLNAIDGLLAREHNMTTQSGFVLNELGDLISDAALYLAFIKIIPGPDFYIYLFVLLAWLGEVAAILGYSICHQRINSGPLGKSDRAFIMSVISLWFVIAPLSLTHLGYYIVIVLNLLLIMTLINRFKKVVTFHE